MSGMGKETLCSPSVALTLMLYRTQLLFPLGLRTRNVVSLSIQCLGSRHAKPSDGQAPAPMAGVP